MQHQVIIIFCLCKLFFFLILCLTTFFFFYLFQTEYGKKWNGQDKNSKISWSHATKKERCYVGRVPLPLQQDGKVSLTKTSFYSTYEDTKGEALFHCDVQARYGKKKQKLRNKLFFL